MNELDVLAAPVETARACVEEGADITPEGSNAILAAFTAFIDSSGSRKHTSPAL